MADGEFSLFCSRCKQEKWSSEFRYRSGRPRTGKRRGKDSRCNDCVRAYSQTPRGREIQSASSRRFLNKMRAENPAELRRRQRSSNLKKHYGITQCQYDRLSESQSGKCRICGRADSVSGRLHIDHDHQTGRIRGLLCGNCNVGIGVFGESVSLLKIAIEYLTSSLIDDLNEKPSLIDVSSERILARQRKRTGRPIVNTAKLD